MGERSSGPDGPVPSDSGPNETTWVFSDPEPATQRLVTPASPPPPESLPPTEATIRAPTEAAFPPPTEAVQHPPTEAVQHPPTEAVQHPPTEAVRQAPPTNFVRYGPGVPVTPEPRAGLTAEDIWRTGLVRAPAPRRRPRLRQALGSAVTVLLLAAAAVILFLRFHHAPFAVTSAVITQQTRSGCTVDVTGKIATSGGAGTVSYQWVFRPDARAPQPLTQSVIAGQKAVFVTVAVEGSGQGSATQSVTLQVLGPDQKSATTAVVIRC